VFEYFLLRGSCFGTFASSFNVVKTTGLYVIESTRLNVVETAGLYIVKTTWLYVVKSTGFGRGRGLDISPAASISSRSLSSGPTVAVEDAPAPEWNADASAGDGWAAAETPAADAGGWGDVQASTSAEPSGFDNVQPSGFDNVQPSGFDNVQPSGFDNVQPSGFDNVEGAGESAEAGPPPNQMTYEEYLEKCNAERKETVFNVRKAGENEDDSQWKNFAPLKKDSQDAYMGGMDEYEKIIVRGGRKKNLVDLDVKFSNPSRRGGRGREDRGGNRRGGERREDRRERDDRRAAPAAPKAPNLESFSEAEFPSLS
jgi:hypothetical protein